MKFLVLYLAPIISVFFIKSKNIFFISEVKGNSDQAIWITIALSAYYLLIIIWQTVNRYHLSRLLATILVMAILALFFLPVRQNISVINYVQTDSKVYWVERAYWSGTLTVYVAEDGFLLQPRRVYQDTSTTHEAFLELSKARQPVLVYSRSALDTAYQREFITDEPIKYSKQKRDH